MFTQPLRMITVFFTISVSLSLFSMNYPVKNKKMIEISPLKQHSYTSWDGIEVRDAIAQTSFGCISKDLFFPMLAMFSPSAKNKLRKTNKVFNYLLSWEKIQPFMLCNELNATRNDIHNLMMQNIDSYQEQELNSAVKVLFLKNVGFDIERDSLLYNIPGYFGQKEIQIIVAKNVLEEVKKLNNHILVNGICSLKEIHPLVKLCLARNVIMVEEYVQKERKLPVCSIEDVKRMLSIMICNNDVNSLLELFNNKIIEPNRMIYSAISECVQLTIMYASPNVLTFLIPYYVKTKAKKSVESNYFEEKDFISGWFDLASVSPYRSLHSIVRDNHMILTKKHEHDLENYHRCLNILFNKKRLKKLNPPVNIIKIDKQGKGRIISCSIM